jgi:exodeoxyribonuclease V beta subunit
MPRTTCHATLPHAFDLASSPLEGFNLIDASAGTGKTYTICGLVLRLLLEKNLSIGQILVVTYTEAATEDLRDRIRQKLHQALDAVTSPRGGNDFLQEYLAGIDNHKEAEQRLNEALRSFDEAAIYTIHGFCQRQLLENSFESNTLFDTELVTDDSYLIKEIIEDFWRRTFSQSSALFNHYAADKLTPDKLYDFLSPFLPHPFFHFIPASDDFLPNSKGLSASETEYNAAFSTVCRAWPAARNEVRNDLLHSPALKRTIYRGKSMPGLIRAMDAMAAAARPFPHLFDAFILLTANRITAGTKKKEIPNILPFYKRCEELVGAQKNLLFQYDRCLLALKKRLLDSFRHELSLRKTRDNIFSFDDLLRRLHEALSGPGGGAFARTLAKKYPAALIDEFQDTDPLQFAIFKAIYHEHSLLFLIGDPKQAIYSFRGADIFTYMDAAAGSPLAHHTLGVNHRSKPALVKAVNTLFSRPQKSFIFDAISFHPVAAAPEQNPEYLTINGAQEEPFILWHLAGESVSGEDTPSPQEKNTKISKTAARRCIISGVAAEITRLLALAAADRARINARRLLPGDIAVLVRTNAEALKMQEALTALQVPSVLHSGDDLFASDEAKEMSLLLGAIETPSSIRRVKAALLTRFIGLQAHAINLLGAGTPDNQETIEYWLTQCRAYHDLWNRYGFMQMFWVIMRENRVRQKLLAAENGERSLTNILHLAEILHREAVNQGLNMGALQSYLQDRLARQRSKNIEHQLRLESDEDRVKIVTIHKAKGLEYPVVFCPFSWEGTRLARKKGFLFHRQGENKKTELVFDAGSPDMDKHLQSALQEEMAENLRLLYVALTRAIHRCYLFWGRISGAETSAPAYLLHQRASETEDPGSNIPAHSDLMKKVAARFLGLSDSEILADLHELAAASEGTIRIASGSELPGTYVLDNKEKAVPLRQREWNGAIARDWKISSFSSLTATRSTVMQPTQTRDDGVPDRDAVPFPGLTAEAETAPEINKYDIFSFPHGARSGTLLHEILEQADFTAEPAVAEHLIYKKIQRFDYDRNWYPAIAQLLNNLGKVRLHKDIPDLKLSNIPPANCLHELEFYFPLSRVTPDDIKNVFCSKDLPGPAATNQALMARQLDRLAFAPARGVMRGFIDLVFELQGKFYLVDWKSNYLGSETRDYSQDKLAESILSGFYFIQYHIYCLALHRYLERRLPGYRYQEHFGGIFYVFLRGIDPELGPDYGIYHDLPALSKIEMLNPRCIAGKTA